MPPEEAEFDFPIVELEADSPQGIGKSGLFDFRIPVGSTGIVFVAALQGLLTAQGPVFAQATQQAAFRRAGSTLAQWGIVSAPTFAFLAQAANLSATDLATRYGVSTPTVQDWLSGQTPVPVSVWQCLATLVCFIDGRNFLPGLAVSPTSLQPRVIRIFPSVPMPTMPQPLPSACPSPPKIC